MYISHPVPSHSLKRSQCNLCSDSAVVMTAADTWPFCLQASQALRCSGTRVQASSYPALIWWQPRCCLALVLGARSGVALLWCVSPGQWLPCSWIRVVIDGNYCWTHHDIFCIASLVRNYLSII